MPAQPSSVSTKIIKSTPIKPTTKKIDKQSRKVFKKMCQNICFSSETKTFAAELVLSNCKRTNNSKTHRKKVVYQEL